ncbi:heat shock 70 kDa protein 12A-like [Mercenaria mercenaria]|uniref:heat shock 70 kDa protein 12A-like n=1 Tax=Mercenaria mercenaria TaxID=6596 RepID=UPI00234F9713|nr:heat shock 70 kDa protein 12A-like [Mercenaria mercenaria]
MAGDSCVVIALDFGSTYIGYAFSHDKECREIFTASSDGYKERIPNAVLLNTNKDLDCIGEAAKRKYADMTENGTHRTWFYFEWYKTVLHKTENLTRDLEVFDSQGRPISGMLLFGMVIQYMKRQAENQIVQALVGIQIEKIKWVLTVPAIWSDSAKQFMREAAYRAGIDAENLKLVLEPEAAAAHCLNKPMCVVVKQSGGTQYEKFHPGQKYILADLGGGTVDICIHEVIEGDKVREIHRAIGDITGGNDVNISFEQLFVKLFGAPTWMKFKTEYMDEYVDLMSNFETKKREFEASSLDTDETIIRIPVGLQDAIREEYNASFADVLQDTTYVDRIHYRRNKMILKHSVMEELFQRTVQSIMEKLQNLLQDMVAIGEFISVLVMVGGFSESKYVRQRMQAEMQGVRVIYPPEGSLAVMKGAVKMGFRRQNPVIKERRAQFNYGFKLLV